MTVVLKRASASRPSGERNDDDFDVLADGRARRPAGVRAAVLARQRAGAWAHVLRAPEVGLPLLGGPRRPQRKPRAQTAREGQYESAEARRDEPGLARYVET